MNKGGEKKQKSQGEIMGHVALGCQGHSESFTLGAMENN